LRLDSLSSEQHYTAQELSKTWAVSAMTIYRIFEDEEGVLIFGSPETLNKRKRISMRIPKSVAERVHQKLHNRGKAKREEKQYE
jgi:hypothetical protein